MFVKAVWVVLNSLLLMCAGVEAHAQVMPLPSLPSLSLKQKLRLLQRWPAQLDSKDESIVLARTISVNIETINLKPMSRDIHDKRGVFVKYVTGGRLAILETLIGAPSSAAFLNVQNEKMPDLPNGSGSSDAVPIRWGELRTGSYLLVKLRGGVPNNDRFVYGPTLYLGSLNDPILTQYRRRLAWKAMPNQKQAHEEEEATLLNPKATELERCVALWSRAQGKRLFATLIDSPDIVVNRKEIMHALARLLAQMRLPHSLREDAIKTCQFDMSKPLAAESDEAMLARYLLHTAARCPDNELVYAAADRIVMLANNAPQGMTRYGPQVYMFPDILQVLKERAQRSDDAKCAQAAGAALWSYQRSHQVRPNTPYEKHAPYITRAIPPFGNTPLERNLKMAAVTL